jgi:uncharacterized protein
MTTAPQVERSLATSLTREILPSSQPRHRDVHLLDGGDNSQLLVVGGSRIFDIDAETLAQIRSAVGDKDEHAVSAVLASLGLQPWEPIGGLPQDVPVRAVSLAVAQKCNLGCTYCYAQKGEFGEAPKDMPLATATAAVDMLLADASRGDRINIAFMGGEPLRNRDVLRAATEYAARTAGERGISVGFSLTTNGTLLSAEDGDFFEDHGFSVTISVDGPKPVHDSLRPFKNGVGSYDVIMKRARVLLDQQRRMQVSARVTVTPFNTSLPKTLDLLVDEGFHSVGFSPMLHSPDGAGEMGQAELQLMLEEMIACGLAFEQYTLRGRRYPFLNMVNALRELDKGTQRPYPCGAGAGYLGVSADGDLAACHRFVGAEAGRMGSLRDGLDRAGRQIWLRERHVDQQSPCTSCWARYLCGGGCHHEVLARGRGACDFIRGWLHYAIQAHGRLNRLVPGWQAADSPMPVM